VWFFTKRGRLKKAIAFAESLAEGGTPPPIHGTNQDLPGRLTQALNLIAHLLETRHAVIEKEESQLSGLLATIREGVLLTDPHGRIVLVNQALRKMFHVRTQSEGKSLIEVFRQEELQKACSQLLSQPGTRSLELTAFTPQPMPLQVNLSTLEKGGAVQGVVGVFIDLTRMKQLEQMRKEFMANISHELKTPLSSIKGYSETILEANASDPERDKEFVKIIHRNAERVERLVENIMALSRLEQHEEELHLEPISMNQVAKEACEELKHLAELKKINIKNNISSEAPLLKIDRSQIQKVFSLLLENAIKFTPKSGYVKIEMVSKSDGAQIRIQDSGPGLLKEDLSRIFERFYRVDKSRSREVGGSGLGLAIAKHIVLAHGGEIWAESQPGQGSTFVFFLPFVA